MCLESFVSARSLEFLIHPRLGSDTECHGMLSLILMIRQQLRFSICSTSCHLARRLGHLDATFHFATGAIVIHTTKALSWPLPYAQKSLHRLNHALLPS